MGDFVEQIMQHHFDPAMKHLAKETLALAQESGASQAVIDSLRKGLELSWLRLKFEDETTSQGSEACAKILEDTANHDWTKAYDQGKTTWKCYPQLASGHISGQFLRSFLSASKVKNVLEVGMFTGYTALSMAESLPADGKVVTIDRDEYLKTFVQSEIQDSPHRDKVDIKIGEALDIMTQMVREGKSFDAVFLDADKSQYEAYLELCFQGNLLRPNGTVVVDNAFMGQNAYTNPQSDQATLARSIRNNPDLHVVLVPIRDGIYLIRRTSDVDGAWN